MAQGVEAILKLANEDALKFETIWTIIGPKTNLAIDTHPLLAKLKISNTNLSALEDFSEVIQYLHAR